jgi:hypothetical protein
MLGPLSQSTDSDQTVHAAAENQDRILKQTRLSEDRDLLFSSEGQEAGDRLGGRSDVVQILVDFGKKIFVTMGRCSPRTA